MATVLAILCSGRRKGYTSAVLESASEGARSVGGVAIERVHLHDYRFGPCTSCFNCVRDPKHRCTLDDDFGKKGRGILVRKLRSANGIIIGDPVHMWGASAMCHLFMERTYPLHWSGSLNGMPLLTISCATNQGFQLEAQRSLTKWAFTGGFRLIGGLPVHAAYFDDALKKARTLGRRLAQAALKDEKRGRKKLSDAARFHAYARTAWSGIEHYLENLSNGTFTVKHSVPERALKQGTFNRPDAVGLLREARDEFACALRYHKAGDRRRTVKHLTTASACWTHATWREFLERKVIKAGPPETYRPI